MFTVNFDDSHQGALGIALGIELESYAVAEGGAPAVGEHQQGSRQGVAGFRL